MLFSKNGWGRKLFQDVEDNNLKGAEKVLRKGAKVDFTQWPSITHTLLIVASEKVVLQPLNYYLNFARLYQLMSRPVERYRAIKLSLGLMPLKEEND